MDGNTNGQTSPTSEQASSYYGRTSVQRSATNDQSSSASTTSAMTSSTIARVNELTISRSTS